MFSSDREVNKRIEIIILELMGIILSEARKWFTKVIFICTWSSKLHWISIRDVWLWGNKLRYVMHKLYCCRPGDDDEPRICIKFHANFIRFMIHLVLIIPLTAIWFMVTEWQPVWRFKIFFLLTWRSILSWFWGVCYNPTEPILWAGQFYGYANWYGYC